MPFIYVISFGCYRKNNSFSLVSDLIIGLLCKIKQLHLGDEYGGGVAVVAIQGDLEFLKKL